MGRRLRVGMIVGEFPRLSETFVIDQIAAIRSFGHEVSIVGNRPSLAEAHHPAIEEFDLLSRTRYRPQRRGASAATVLAAGRDLVRATRLQPRVVPGLLRGGVRTRAQRARHVLPVLASGPHDVLHGHFGDVAAAIVDGLAGVDDRTPLVVSFHGFDITRFIEQHGRQVYSQLFERAALLLPVNEHFRDDLIAMGASSERTFVHHMGIPVEEFAFTPPEERAGPLRILSVGRFVEKKGFSHGLRAIAASRDAGIDLRYTLIGDGPLRHDLESLVQELGLGDVVRFLGSRTRPEVLDAYRDHDVFLAPSVTASDGDREGIPVVLMEALASGLPAVSSVHSGIPELIQAGSSGLLAAEGDVDALADHLASLAGDLSLRQRLALEGRAAVELGFDSAQLYRRLESWYLEVAAR